MPKHVPDWLEVDVTLIVVGLAIIVVGAWIM
jgi:hypothetical protein